MTMTSRQSLTSAAERAKGAQIGICHWQRVCLHIRNSAGGASSAKGAPVEYQSQVQNEWEGCMVQEATAAHCCTYQRCAGAFACETACTRVAF